MVIVLNISQRKGKIAFWAYNNKIISDQNIIMDMVKVKNKDCVLGIPTISLYQNDVPLWTTIGASQNIKNTICYLLFLSQKRVTKRQHHSTL